MAKVIEYDKYLTDTGFSDGDRYRRGKKARKLYNVEDKILGGVSDDAIFDLKGNGIAALKSKTENEGDDGRKIRVAEYSSETRGFRLVDNKLYSIEDGHSKLVGYYKKRERNAPRITALSVLAAALAAIIAIIALIGYSPIDESTVKPIIEIKDVNGDWEAQGTVAVFPSKLKPGDEGEYGFVLNNPHEEEMNYSFSLEPIYEGVDIDYFPIEFKLKMNNMIVVSDRWRHIDELNFSDMHILGNTSQSFALQWRWAFDGENEKDTIIGRDGGKISIVIHVTAQER